MIPRKVLLVISVILVLATAVSACGGPAPTPTPTPPLTSAARPPSGASRCGDGICDDVERADPNLCPQDCAATQSAPTPAPPTPTKVPPAATHLPPTTVPPTNPPQQPTSAARGKCGDGVCDAAEQKDPSLCPQDCATPAATESGTEPQPTSRPQPTPGAGATVGGSATSPTGEFALIGDPNTVHQTTRASGEARQANLALILDASGSMRDELPGTGKTKLAVAKEVMAELIPQIPADVNGTLWIYAHRYPGEPKSESCQDIEQVFPLGPVDAAAYVAKIQGIDAIGWTPIADSLEQAARALPVGDLNSIILVSDGEETCGGDPCALAEALKASDVQVTIHVVGYAVDQVTQEQLQCIASVSGGTYHDAQDASGLLEALQQAMAASVAETVLRVEVVGYDGAEEHANVHLYQAGSSDRIASYVAWKDNAVPPGNYDLWIDTLPWLYYGNLAIPEGSTTTVHIVLGTLKVLSPEGEPRAADYYEANTGTRLGYWGHEGPVNLVPATYSIQINGSSSAPITVRSGQTVELVLGTILVLDPDGQPVAADFYAADDGTRLGYWGHDGPVEFVPGSYYAKVNLSTSEVITVDSGESEELLLGAIEASGSYEVWDAKGTRLGYYSDRLLLVPGTYTVTLSSSATREGVVVRAGQVTKVQ
jgi:Mg-chelatase subunit ChlD